jgi:Holliday junction resolvasome RuvABC endonuclease subunit
VAVVHLRRGVVKLTKAVLPDRQTYQVIGIDAGSTVFGVSEFELSYLWKQDSFLTLARLDDFYSFKVHAGTGWPFDRRLMYIYKYFEAFPQSTDARKCVAYIEDVPFARNIKTHADLHQLIGAIKIGLFQKGWAVNTVNNSTWKKVVVGNGHAKKADVRLWATGGNIPADPSEMNEDNLDALAVGYYGITQLANQLRYDVTEQRAVQKIMWK